MNIYQHYSFDLWLTLIKSNPSFKEERARFFYDHFNQRQLSMEEVARIFRRIDIMCNAINEKTGSNIDAEEMYLMVISELNDDAAVIRDLDLPALYREMDALVLKYLPTVYCSNTVKVLRTIKEIPGSTISLLSNTGFIKGATLRLVLQELKLDRFFDFQLYSDENGMSKPNEQFFRLMLENVARVRQEGVTAPGNIIHIGDNVKADIQGGNVIGIRTLLINSNKQCISSLLN
ncbi:HAD family hydrolase [Chitinophaga agrisoli]|uniref:HAD family hydrolase n=1 Tax=Chitinophaga agrisoli TaxID=2607653 RepID=A0A5B2W021_9BACT|nr:HAD family hydrolase [Chitinophaga agrisoli]KAA2244434.1 HAD family hydrolase [Chitinophaga agrisoli]